MNAQLVQVTHHTMEDLVYLQALPLYIKVMLAKDRIREFVAEYGTNGCYISFSGGKDSTVLLYLVRSLYPEIPAVYINTGLEYPEITEFAHCFNNVEFIRPKMNFYQVIRQYGYPLISKEQAGYIYEFRNTKSKKLADKRWFGDEKGSYKIAENFMRNTLL